MKNRGVYWKRYKIQETLFIGEWCLSSLQSWHPGTSHWLSQHLFHCSKHSANPLLESPSAIQSYFPESHQWSEITSLSKVILVLGKVRNHRAPNLGCRGLSHLGWQSLLIATRTCSTFSGFLLVADLPEHRSLSTDSWPSLKHMCHSFICVELIASSPKAFWIIWLVSEGECSNLMKNLMEIRSFWIQYPHSTCGHSVVSTAPPD